MKTWVREFVVFGLKEANASIFAGLFFLLLFLSNHIPLMGLPRYDFLFIAAVAIQIILYFTKLETLDEIKVIFLFHIIGLMLELYKTSPWVGSWSYPEFSYLKLYTVPLYSGFMYAAVGSYLSRAWKLLRVKMVNAPSYAWSVVLCALIYVNFFTNHFLPDFRIALILMVFVFFFKTKIEFTVTKKVRSMPLNLAFLLIAFFIWIAENISTYYGAWQYPSQIHAWSVVGTGKITSWFLLVIISFIIVAYLKHYKGNRISRK